MTGQKSMREIPDFSREDLARAFALVVREALQADPHQKRAIAQILGVSEDTVAIWARGQQDKLPGSFTLCTLLSYLDGWRQFRGLLERERDSVSDALSRALVAVECAERLIADHPSSDDVEAAASKLIGLMAGITRLMTALTELRRARLGNVVELPDRHDRSGAA